jgi:hypothetical protein
MKKLGKLNLKAEKILSHEELVNFKGGSGETCGDTWWVCDSYRADAESQCLEFCNGDCTILVLENC